MNPMILSIILGIAGIVVGIVLGKIIFSKDTKKNLDEAELQVKKMVAEAELHAETLKKEKIFSREMGCLHRLNFMTQQTSYISQDRPPT